MMTTDEAKVVLEQKLGEVFGEYPVAIQESPEDCSTLWVQVFAVPSEKVRTVKDFILSLQDVLAPDGDVLLLPMVKNEDVTRQHYGQFAPRDPGAVLAACGRYFDRIADTRYVPAGGIFVTAVGFAADLFPYDNVRSGLLSESYASLRPVREPEKSPCEDLALAA